MWVANKKKSARVSGRQESTLDGERIYKRLDLGEFELYDSVEGPHTLHQRLSVNPTIIFFFAKEKDILATC